MKLKIRLMLFTAAAAFSANMAYGAIDPQALADSYTAAGYSYVEIKQGPTQTKIEAIKDGVVVEAVYSNDTGAIISQDSQAVDPENAAKTGVEIKMVGADSEDAQNGNDDGDQNDTNANDDQGDNNQSTGDDNNGNDSGGGSGNGGGSGDGGGSGGESSSD